MRRKGKQKFRGALCSDEGEKGLGFTEGYSGLPTYEPIPKLKHEQKQILLFSKYNLQLYICSFLNLFWIEN